MPRTPSFSAAGAAPVPEDGARLWNRGFMLACLANVLMFFNVHFLLSTVAGYVVGRFLVGDSVGGGVASVFIMGTFVARFFAGPLIERFGARPLLLIAFAAFVAAPLLYWASPTVGMLLAVRTVHGVTFGVGGAPGAPGGGPRPGWARFVEPGALPTAAIAALYSLGYAGIVSFLATLTLERGFGATASLFFAVYGATVLVSRLFTGTLMDRRGANVVMLPAFVLFAAGLAVVAMAHHVVVLLLAAVLVGLGYGQLQSAGQVICVTQVPRERAGMGASTYFLGVDAGMGLGPLLAGILVQSYGTAGLYWLLAVFLLALVPVYWLVQGRRLRRPAVPVPEPAPAPAPAPSQESP